ncbi:pentatricopeptide repeat-containing protein At4g21705, mitochondrial-like [Magnolia sinica]|uniref:pentatricopeptide repeat-containing protein At4g21705, mitochondrial-like n=1 Tax=Magnolia sinica TaxID=86752 RepID=UPI002659051C|nr:pentatricopeptide repeat-containing protein At4g21705, mitochondrial-like [Magnolia sinica]
MDSASSFFSLLARLARTVRSDHRFPAVRSYYSGRFAGINLYSKISPIGNPNISVVPELDRWVDTGKNVRVPELQRIIRDLRKRRRHAQALEVSEWMANKGVCVLTPGDHAVQLDLIGKVRGLASAESYFNSISEENKTEKPYGALLNCYVRECLVDKSLAHMQKMKDLGFTNQSLPYNDLMCLYTNTGQHEKVLDVLAEMKENGVLPDNFSYRICINSYGARSDIEGMEKILEEMEQQPFITMDWNTYATVANIYIKAGLTEEAVAALKKSEEKLLGLSYSEGYNHLMSLYGNLGDKPELLRIWELKKSVCQKLLNRDYSTILGSLVKLGELEEAESLLKEWEMSGNGYDFRVPNVLLIGYCQKGLVEKADTMIERLVKEGRTPIPNSFGIIAAAYVKKGEMGKAVEYMKRAISVFPGNEGWRPNQRVVSSVLGWLGDEGDAEGTEAFVRLLSAVIPMNREMYHALIKANVRAGKDVEGILESMRAENIETDEEMEKILSLRGEK